MTIDKLHPAVKPDILVNSGALNLALNSLKRGSVSQQEIAAELESTAVTLQVWQDQVMNNLKEFANNVTFGTAPMLNIKHAEA